MPTPVTQQIQDQVAPYMTAAGVPSVLTPAVWQALDAAGYTVVTKSAGVPAQALDVTPSERVRIDGLVGSYLLGVKIGERGWMVCVEQSDGQGSTTRSAWVFTPDPGDLLLRAKTTGRWTVGDSGVAGTDVIS